jgi:hypothetical protein
MEDCENLSNFIHPFNSFQFVFLIAHFLTSFFDVIELNFFFYLQQTQTFLIAKDPQAEAKQSRGKLNLFTQQ